MNDKYVYVKWTNFLYRLSCLKNNEQVMNNITYTYYISITTYYTYR